MTESNVAIAPDSVATGAHNVRTITVQVDNSAVVAGGQAEQQQVVTLAGADGSVVNVDGQGLAVFNTEITALLRAILLRLDFLNAAVSKDYSPPDDNL